MNAPTMQRADMLDTLAISQVETLMRSCTTLPIQQVNWPEVSTYRPFAQVRLAWSGTAIYLVFTARTDCMRATHTASLSPVCQDDCVEFFMRLPGSHEYWNFEFNCIGTINASRRVRRDAPTRLTEEEIRSIDRWSSVGAEAFGDASGLSEWSLAVRIPFTLLGIVPGHLPPYILANFYKCGDRTIHPHYLSWKQVHTAQPNFHHTEDFAPIYLTE